MGLFRRPCLPQAWELVRPGFSFCCPLHASPFLYSAQLSHLLICLHCLFACLQLAHLEWRLHGQATGQATFGCAPFLPSAMCCLPHAGCWIASEHSFSFRHGLNSVPSTYLLDRLPFSIFVLCFSFCFHCRRCMDLSGDSISPSFCVSAPILVGEGMHYMQQSAV